MKLSKVNCFESKSEGLKYLKAESIKKLNYVIW